MPKISDKPVKKIMITLLQETHEQLKALSEEISVPVATLVRVSVQKFLEKNIDLIKE